jgi:two-component system OmpR family response regulator
MRILIVEDNVELARQIKATLEHALYVADVANDGEEGCLLGDTEHYDAVILDLGLPKLDGIELLERWRSVGHLVPVIVLSSRHTWREKVTGLRAGADDYLAKPFEHEELLARLEALIRRSGGHASDIFTCDCRRVVMDTSCARVTMDGRIVDLTALEYRTLRYLMQHKGKVVSKNELTAHIYNQDFDRTSNVIEVMINRLRGKLCPGMIHTRRGLGYQLGPV